MVKKLGMIMVNDDPRRNSDLFSPLVNVKSSIDRTHQNKSLPPVHEGARVSRNSMAETLRSINMPTSYDKKTKSGGGGTSLPQAKRKKFLSAAE